MDFQDHKLTKSKPSNNKHTIPFQDDIQTQTLYCKLRKTLQNKVRQPKYQRGKAEAEWEFNGTCLQKAMCCRSTEKKRQKIMVWIFQMFLGKVT